MSEQLCTIYYNYFIILTLKYKCVSVIDLKKAVEVELFVRKIFRTSNSSQVSNKINLPN